MNSQHGIGSFKAVAAIAAISLTFLAVFIFAGLPASNISTGKSDGGKTTVTPPAPPASPPNGQPTTIRIPDDYSTYVNTDYKISFTYPTVWNGTLNIYGPGGVKASSTQPTNSFNHYALGNSFLNGEFSVYADSKDTFKTTLRTDGAVLAPVKLGDGYGWKVVGTGSADPSSKIGDSYDIKSTKYQSGVLVYNFSANYKNTLQSQWVFSSGDKFISITLPILSRPDGSLPSTADIALYNVVSNNIAKTARPTN